MEQRGLRSTWARRAAAVVLAVVLGSVGAQAGQADPSETYGIYRMEDAVLTDPVQGAAAEIVRHDDRVEFTLTTTELQRHAYTVWLIVYNFPQACTDPDTENGRDFRCGQGDMLNLAAGFSIMYGAGHEVAVSQDRFDTFTGSRDRLDPDGVLVGPGLVDPRGAEIHLIVRDHGPCPESGCGNRTTTADGGCSNPHFGGILWPIFGDPGDGDYECKEVQATGY